ncbi:MAG: hypothetical protein AAGA68_16860 [Pseudomonadota bacterium]
MESEGGVLAFGVTTSLLDPSDPLMAFDADLGPDGCYGALPADTRAYLDSQETEKDQLLAQARARVVELLNPLQRGRVEGNKLELLEVSIPFEQVADDLESSWDDVIKTAKDLGTQDELSDAVKAMTSESFSLSPANSSAPPDYQDAKRRFAVLAIALNSELSDRDGALYEKIPVGPRIANKVIACRQETQARLRVAANLDVGAAALWRGEPGDFDRFDGGGTALWTSAHRGVWPKCVRSPTAKLYDHRHFRPLRLRRDRLDGRHRGG